MAEAARFPERPRKLLPHMVDETFILYTRCQEGVKHILFIGPNTNHLNTNHRQEQAS